MANKIVTTARRLIGQASTMPVIGPAVLGVGSLFQFGESNLVDQPKDSDGDVVSPGPGTIIKAQVAERWVNQVGRGLTPETLSAYLEESIAGYTLNLFSLFEEMEEKCPELRVAIYKHRLKAARRTPRIVAPDRAQNPDLAKRKADHAAFVFAEMKNWHATAFNLMDAVGKGISVAEIDWQMGAVQGMPSVLINEMKWVNHRHLGWWWDKPELQLFPDLRNRADHIDVPDRKFVVFHHLSKSGHPSRAAMLRPLAWYFLIYLYAIKDWSTLAETFGIDVAHAFCKKDATPEQRNAILMHLSRMAARCGVFDEGTVINLQRATGGGTAPQEGLVKYLVEQMVIAFLGASLGTQAGQHGARSLGLVQQDETEELVDWTCLQFAGTMTSGPLRWLMDFNFAERCDNPVMELPGANRRDLAALANVINILVNLGCRVPEAWTHAQFDIPAPKETDAGGELPDDGNIERILSPSKNNSPQGDQSKTDEAGNPLVGREAGEHILGYSTLREHTAQAALDQLRVRALKQGVEAGAFEQIAGPIKAVLVGAGDPGEAMARVHKAASQIDPVKLQGIAKEMFILVDLVSRGSVREQTRRAS